MAIVLTCALMFSASWGQVQNAPPEQAHPGVVPEEHAAIVAPEVVERAIAPYRDEARALLEDARARIDARLEDASAHEKQPIVRAPSTSAASQASSLGVQGYRIYVSLAMGETVLRDLLRTYRDSPVEIVFRGLPPGEKLRDMVARIRPWLGELQADDRPLAVGVTIDPEAFSRLNIQAVPVTVAIAGDAERSPIAWARGVTSIGWLTRRIEAGDRGDLGVHGATVDVLEPDLIEVLKARAEALTISPVDAEKAVARYWERTRFASTRPAPTHRKRHIDPEYIVRETVTTPDGHVIAVAGQRLNPLKAVPWTQTVIVFDALDPRECDWVAQRIADAPHRYLLISTRFDRRDGFDGVGRLWARYRQPVYLLPAHLQERLQITYTPSLVYADGHHVIVEEVALKDIRNGAPSHP